MTELHDNDGPGGELIPFPGPRVVPELPDSLELADVAENQPPATRQGRQPETPTGKDLALDESIDAEIVDEDETPRQPVNGVVRRARQVRRAVHQVRQHEPTVVTSKWLLRQVAYVFAGGAVVLQRWHAKRTRYDRVMSMAEDSGDMELWKEVEQRGEAAKERKHKRLLNLLAMPIKLIKAAAWLAIGGTAFLLFVGVIVFLRGGGSALGPLLGAMDTVVWVAAVIGALWGIAVSVLPFLAAGVLWHFGRQAQMLPRSLRLPTAPGDMMPSELTEDTITAALCDTVPDFARAVKGGWKVRYRIPPRADEGGTHFQIDLPPKAPVEVFVKKRDLLAHNLRRFPIEVWPTEPIAGVLDGWVADPGVLTKPVGPWPVLKDLDHAQCDYFKGIPVSKTLRGHVVASPLSQKNYFLAGIMGSGKSSMAITLVLGAILDPLVDVDVVVMAENADYEPMRPALRSLHTGAEPDTVEAAIRLLRDRFRSLGELGELLREQMAITQAQGREPDKFICREYAEREPLLRPRVIVIDECQNLFMSEHGKDAEVIVKQLVTTARKYATTLIFVTPDPTGDAIPSGVVRIMSNRACFPIGDQIGNDAAIGTGSHKIGLTAANLVPAIDDQLNDAGTCAARGFTNPPGMLRCFYVPQSDAHRVTKRALQLRGGGRRLLAAAPPAEKRDLLADVGTVIGEQTVRAADIPPLLAKEFPGQVLYQQMTGKQLRKLLKDDYDVQVPSTDNVHPVSPKLIAEGLERRRNEAAAT